MQPRVTRLRRPPVRGRSATLWVLAVVTWTAFAQPTPGPIDLRVEGQQVWLEAEQVPLVTVLEALAGELGFELHTAGTLDRPVDVRSEGERLEPVLRRITRPDSMVIEYARSERGDRRLAKVRVYARGEATLAVNRQIPALRVDALAETLVDGGQVEARIDAARRLGALGTDEALAALAFGLEDDDARVRRQVVDAIASIAEEAAIPLLAQAALADESAGIRVRAIRRLAGIGGEAAREIVEAAVDDESEAVSAEATLRLERWR